MLANIIRNSKKTGIGGGGGGIVIDNGDPFYSAVSLLLPMDGTNGSTTFTDSSLNGLTVTSSGVTISDTGARSGFGQFADFPGSSSSALTIPASSVFNFGTGDFTIEFWFNIPVGASGSPFGKTFVSTENNVWSAGAFSLYALASSTQFRPSFWINEFSSSVPILLPSSGDYRDGNWHHFAVVRSGSAFSMYIDGVRVANGTHAGNCGSSTRNLMIGDNLANNGGDRNFLGKLDDFRISLFARYTSNFAPPTAALPTTASSTPADPFYGYTSLLLHMDGTSGSTNFVDSGPNALAVTAVGNAQISTTQSKYGGASGYFDGSAGYLSPPASSGFSFGTGNVTIEAWVYPTATTGNFGIYATSAGGGAVAKFVVFLDSLSPNCHFYGLTNGNNIYTKATSTVAVNQWSHIAFVRSGTTWTWYINGVASGSGTNSTAITFSTEPTYIGYGGQAFFNYFNGYIDDLRTTKYARYTSAFAPPAQAHLEYANGNDRHFSNVSLLLHMDGANGSTTFTDNSSNALTITRTGTPAISTAQSVFGGSSASFDGTGQYISPSSSTGMLFGTGDFTVEFWFYANSLSSTAYSCLMGFHNGGSEDWGVFARSNGVWMYGGGAGLVGGGTVSTGAWNYFAASKSGTTVRTFLNGTQVGVSTSATGNYTNNAGNAFRIGDDYTTVNPSFNGLIDDIRISKFARYSANFTPPTTAHPNA